jgi:hypothetical protein
MEIPEQVARLNNVLQGAKPYEDLLANDAFVHWRDTVVKERLESILQQIKTVDRTQPNWRDLVCDAVIAYQEANLTYIELFKLSQLVGEQARAELKELSEAQG